MIVGFTGTRQPLADQQICGLRNVVQLLKLLGMTEGHHGDCQGGDQQFDNCCITDGVARVVHPPTNDQYRAHCDTPVDGSSLRVESPTPYMERNDAIIAAADVLVACPAQMQERLRSGTWATVRRARKKGIPIVFVWMDGTTSGMDVGPLGAAMACVCRTGGER